MSQSAYEAFLSFRAWRDGILFWVHTLSQRSSLVLPWLVVADCDRPLSDPASTGGGGGMWEG